MASSAEVHLSLLLFFVLPLLHLLPPPDATKPSTSLFPHRDRKPVRELHTKTQTQIGNLWVKPAWQRLESPWLEGGIQEKGQMPFYCYLPKWDNYIWSLMWNLFCRLSVNKLCGSLQAAYLTFSVHFLHTGSTTFTHAVNRGASTGTRSFQFKATEDSLIIFTMSPQTFSVLMTPCTALLSSFLTSIWRVKVKILCVCSLLHRLWKRRAAPRICVFTGEAADKSTVYMTSSVKCIQADENIVRNIHVLIL